MRTDGKAKPRSRKERRAARRPYLINADDFETTEDAELFDWMFGFPNDALPSS